MKNMVGAALLALLLGSVVAYAQTSHGSHGAEVSGDTAATMAFRAANAKMHKDMDIRFTNDADADFVRGMIPHHQGAIDMAKILLEHGKDERTRRWAEGIIREQEREIGEMQAWLDAGKPR